MRSTGALFSSTMVRAYQGDSVSAVLPSSTVGLIKNQSNLKRPTNPLKITGESVGGYKTFQVALVAVGKALPVLFTVRVPVASHVEAAVVGEAKFFYIAEQRCFFVVRNKLDIAYGGIGVVLVVVQGVERGQRVVIIIAVRPQTVVGSLAFHQVSKGKVRSVGTRRVHVSSQDQRIADVSTAPSSMARICLRLHAGGHLFSRWALTTVTTPPGSLLHFKISKDGDTAAAAYLPLNLLQEDLVRGETLCLLDFGDALDLPLKPVMTCRQVLHPNIRDG